MAWLILFIAIPNNTRLLLSCRSTADLSHHPRTNLMRLLPGCQSFRTGRSVRSRGSLR
jgi:hypothetical protein